MPFLTATQIADAQLSAASALTSAFENRSTEYGAIRAINDDQRRSGLVTSTELERMKQSERQPTTINVLKKGTVTDTDSDSCNISGDQSVSARIPLTLTKYGFTVKHYPELYGENDIAATADLAKKIREGFERVYTRLDLAALAFLEANKTAATPTSSYFDIAGGAFNFTGKPGEMYAYVSSLMALMDMSGPFYSVADTEYMSRMLINSTYGAGQGQNLAALQGGNLQYAAQIDQYFTNRLNKGANIHKMYVVQKGTTGLVSWRHPQYRNGARIDEADRWGTTSDPLLNLLWETHYIRKCTDGTTEHGLALPPATPVENMWFGVKAGFVKSYSSNTTTPIVPITINEEVVIP